MGCNPFGRMMSVFRRNDHGGGRRRSNKRWKKQKRDAMEEGRGGPQPTVVSHYGNPVVRSVIYSNNSPIVVMQPEAPYHYHHGPPPDLAPSEHAYATATAGPHEAPPPAPTKARVRFALPEAEGHEDAAVTHAATAHPARSADPYQHYHHQAPEQVVGPQGYEPFQYQQVQHYYHQQQVQHRQEAAAPVVASGYQYVPSPLTGPSFTEYQYYPTPVRDGVYRLATDSSRLTTMFSDENPNACTIV